MFERLTDRAHKVMAYANQEAQQMRSESIGSAHILLGLIKEGSGVGANVLKNLNVNLAALRVETKQQIATEGAGPPAEAKKVLELAILETRSLNHNYVGTEHLLLGMLRLERSVPAKALNVFGVTHERVLEELETFLKSIASQGSGSHSTLPDELPMALQVLIVPERPDWARLTDEYGNVVSPIMRIELAREIVKRYNKSDDQSGAS